MSLPVRSCLAVLGLLALPAAAEDGPQLALKDSTCTMSIAKGDLISRGKKLVVEGDQGQHDAVALRGDVVVRAGATVKNVLALRGNVTVEKGARVTGEVAALGGSVHVAEGATLEGKVSALGGQIDAAPGAKLLGEKNQLSLRINGTDPLQMIWGQIISDQDLARCELRVKDD